MDSEAFLKRFEDEKKALEERLSGKHIHTLACLQTTQKENDRLRHRVSELEGYKLKVDYYEALEQQVHSQQEELSKCERLHSLGRNVEEKINEAKEECSQALRDYQEEIEERYKNQVTKLRSEQNERVKAWEDDKIKMKKFEEDLRERNKLLQDRLEAAALMEREINNLREEVSKTVRSFEEMKTRYEELQQSKDDIEELCSFLESEKISLQEKLEDSAQSKKNLRKEMNTMVMKITKYVKRINKLEKDKDTVSRLEFENSWVKHLHEKTVSELRGLQMKHRDILSQLQVVTQDRNFLKSELLSAQEEVTKLKSEMHNSKHSFAEFLELRKQVDVLQEENKNLQKKSRTYKIKLLKADTTESQKQIVPLKLKAK